MDNIPTLDMSVTSVLDKLNYLYQQGNHSEVIDHAMAHGINPVNDPLSSNILAASYFMVGSYQESNNLLEQLYPSFESNPDFLSLYATNSRRLGNFSLAKKLFVKSIELSPSNHFIQNNYANLLIDVGELDQAINILSSITSKHPDYQEAKDNYSRACTLKKMATDSPALGHQKKTSLGLEDPLLLAFNQDEIEFSNQRYMNRFKKTPLDPILNDNSSPQVDDLVQDEFTAIELALAEGNSGFALKLCSSIKQKLPLHPRVYELASDAYLSKKLFYEAECSLLQSLMLGGKSLKHYFNLSTFASIRKDFSLSIHYAELALEMDSSSEHAKSLLSSLRNKQEKSNFNFQKSWDLTDSLSVPKVVNEY